MSMAESSLEIAELDRIGQGYYVKSSSELERIENANTQIGDVGGVACHQCRDGFSRTRQNGHLMAILYL